MTDNLPMGPGATQERLVFRSDALEVISHPGDSDFLLITFSEMGMRANGRHWWAAPVARKHGIAALGFVATRPNWFPEATVAAAAAAPAVAGILGAFRQRLAYGFSMGGHAAIRHAPLLGAGAVLAIAPQWSIDPDDTREGDSRFARHFDPLVNRGMRIGPQHGADHTYMIFDPRDSSDLWNAARIADAVSHAIPVHARSTGHWTAAALADSDAAGRMFAAAIAGDARALRRAVADARRRWHRRPLVLGRQIARLRPRVALRIAERYAGTTDGVEQRMIVEGAADALLGRGTLEEAEAAARLALGLDAKSHFALMILAEVAFRRGDGAQAVALARQSVALTPASPGAHLRLAAFLRRTGQAEAAEAARSRGLELQKARA